MEQPLNVELAKRPQNAIGALRLLFASLVIVSHTPEMIDGNSGREPLHYVFGTLTSGYLAVDAFFLISGYLIAASFAASSSLWSYLLKRVLRIVPAFLVCSLICIFLVAPLAGAHLQALGLKDWLRVASRLVTLKAPEINGAFVGLPYQALNGSAWTISYEFRCYILAALFGLIGLYRKPNRRLFLGLTGLLLISNFIFLLPQGRALTHTPGWFDGIFGAPEQALRLLSAFVVGTCFWLYKDKIVYRWPIAAGGLVLLGGLMFVPVVAEVALILLGGYAMFAVAFTATWKPLHTINAKDDISYGVYLYAWPIAALIFWSWRDVPPVALGLLTFAGALALGAVSWFLVEKPAMNFRNRLAPSGAASQPAAAG